MAIAVDSSSPAVATGTVNINLGGTVTSASFTAPADSFLSVCVAVDGDSGGGTLPDPTCSDSVDGTTGWTTQVQRLVSETTVGGGSGIFTKTISSAVSRTVTITLGARTGTANWGSGRVHFKVYVLTGVDISGTPVDSVTASNEGGTNTDPTNTTNITPGASGLFMLAACDWNATAQPLTSSNLTIETATYSGAITAVTGYRTSTSGVALNGNLNPSATPQFKWCQINVREAAGGSLQPPIGAFARNGNRFIGGLSLRKIVYSFPEPKPRKRRRRKKVEVYC